MNKALLQDLKSMKPDLETLKKICFQYKLPKIKVSDGLLEDDFIEGITQENIKQLYDFLDGLSIDQLVIVQAVILFGESCYCDYHKNEFNEYVFTERNFDAYHYFSEIFYCINYQAETKMRDCAEEFIMDKRYVVAESIQRCFYLLKI